MHWLCALADGQGMDVAVFSNIARQTVCMLFAWPVRNGIGLDFAYVKYYLGQLSLLLVLSLWR